MKSVYKYLKNMGWKQWVMLIPAIAGSGCMYYAFNNEEFIPGVLSFLTVFIPVIVWISDYQDSQKKHKQFIQLQEEVKGYGFELVDNPEWLWVIIDADKHILFGIKSDGNVEWALGVPEPIKKEIEELKIKIIALETKKN